MLFRALDRPELDALIGALLEHDEVIGPKRVGTRPDGKPLHRFLPITSVAELDLAYETTEFSAKTYFLPFKETLSAFRFDDGDWQQEIIYRGQPRALVGLHACDIAALVKLDKVLAREFFPSPYYVARRQNTLVIGIDHEPCAGGFCQSVGADTVDSGFDLFLTDLGDRYFVAIGSDRGHSALGRVKTRPITEEDRHEYRAVRCRIADGFKTRIDAHALPRVLDIEFESAVWKRWGEKCLSCGSCAMVCPTCYCYGVSERVSMDFALARKVRQLHSCNLVDFAVVAGGHNFRPSATTRLKYRYYHQHRGFNEQYEEPKCVGCNRCGRACLVGINPPDVIRELLAEERP